jgi:hypothetical protein
LLPVGQLRAGRRPCRHGERSDNRYGRRPATNVAAVAPDGLGPGLTDGPKADVPAKPKRTAQRRRDSDSFGDASSGSRYRGDSWEEQQATDRADEEQLKRKLIICQNCSSSAN